MSRPSSDLAHLFRQLKAPAAAAALPKLADGARAEEWSYEKFVAALLKTETDSRAATAAKRGSRGRGLSDEVCVVVVTDSALAGQEDHHDHQLHS